MNINRHNYEEYFILYMDNELSSDDRRMVEQFIQQHPDLKDELETLQQYKLEPDAEIVFNNKEELMKVEGEKPVLLSNYEEWLILYNDNELTPAQRITAEEFMDANPVFRKEQELLLKTKLQPETIIFPDKASLYRQEEKVRRFPVRWWRMAAAAILLLAVGTTAVIMVMNNNKPGHNAGNLAKGSNNNRQNNISPANTSSPVRENIPVVNGDKENNNIALKEDGAPEKQAGNINSNNAQPVKQAVAVEKSTRINNNKQDVARNNTDNTPLQPVKTNSPENKTVNSIAFNDQKPSNNLPAPDNNRILNQLNNTNNNNLGTATAPVPDQNDGNNGVTSVVYNPSKNNTEDMSEDLEEGGKNKKNRGFFRKLTRTFIKRSNASTKDDENDSKLLVGGFAFRMK